MKRFAFYFGLATALVASCSIQEEDFETPQQDDVVFYASFEKPAETGTKVYATEDLYLRWNADDRITIFNKYTYNQEYRFNGETGDNSGSFKRMDNGDFVTGNYLDYIYAVYPYQESTRISDVGEITVTLPAEQMYAENTFGLGANTMVSATTDNQLLFKNAGGYLVLKLYGDNVTVSSITLKGNAGERIAGKATLTMPVDGIPSVNMAADAGQMITLTCDTPVKIGSTAESATAFWLVVPPTVFSKGFTLVVRDNKNGVFEKATSKSLEISRNNLSKMAVLEVSPELPDEVIVFADETVKTACVAKYDTNGDGELSYKEAAAVKSISGLFDKSRYIKSFDEFRFFTSVTSIPSKFFAQMTLLSSIILPESITSIGSFAFYGCTKLEAFHFPVNVERVDARAFEGCRALRTVTFAPGSHLYSLGSSSYTTFDGNSNSQYYGIFTGCSALERIVIPASVSSIGYRLFYNCSSLREVIFEEGSRLTSIPGSDWNGTGGPFYNCTALEVVKLPDSLQSIGYMAFYGCRSLKTINLPPSITSINLYAFSGCTAMEGDIVLPNCRTINSSAFNGCQNIHSVTLSDNCTVIGSSAFAGCSNLVSITLSLAQTTIESGTFSGCTSLKDIKLPQYLSSIGGSAFSNCISLASLEIPSSVEVVGSSAFNGCTGLTSLTIPDGVREISSRAFANCTGLTSVSIPSCVETIGSFVFDGCSGLTSYRLPDGMKEIPEGLFENCTSLTSIVIPSSVETIGRYAYNGCSGMTSLTIEEGVKTINAYAFQNCTSLTSVSIPSSIETIGDSAFYGCAGMTSLTLSEGVKTIERRAFYNCSGLTSVELPASVQSIGQEVFRNCSSLGSIVCLPQIPPTGGSSMFYNTNNCPIYVPSGSVETYKSSDIWSTYSNRIQAIQG